MNIQELQKEIVNTLMEKGVLVTTEILKKVKDLDNEEKINFVKTKIETTTVLTTDNVLTTLEYLSKNTCDVKEGNVEVVFSYKENNEKKKEVADFVTYFRNRYKALERILKNRPELQRTLSISRVLDKNKSETVSIIGLVTEKRETKNGNLLLVLEDLTGSMNVLINKNKEDLFEEAKDIVLDEVIGIVGTNKETIIFVNNVLWPDIPLHKELKKSPDEAYAIFLSDVHYGSIDFLPDKLNKFLSWLNGEIGSEEHKNIIPKIKYLFIAGDLVEGIGIYPGQEEELTVKDIYDQYSGVVEYLKKIPSHIKIIICPGNHDAMRISEPQPIIHKELAPELHAMPNVIQVSNPGIVKIHKSEGFPGFDVLLYHGYSFDYYVSNVDSIRNQGGYHRADLIMQFLLKRRHLSPTHTATLYVPDITHDPLVLTTVPDFFLTGHIHYTYVEDYHNITLICGSCWQRQTSFQLKVGHDPEPARVPLVNLKTRKVKILKF
ncbi:DNA-directed DNA polymerase II small subunit [Candidatus Woesearchaeota archaeon]|jgi:DNA polymerase II small subunit|nr:DNA-directed DNA polymerase II small subunit [Candidatus Woesearchaeota archaeon]MBT4367759.1 DNA-directed DNA polymerase II small subunit [Candidatus Woesearchaeota archaeon]MBT4712247.1 DNA-directed DNA polymerase II small subunit [Candidatus Woesearchaeota archaeon]MBT6638795.1 DNA-directed DNA polymerase II small subunit [Candidatus Woesearchaeota archaeon]MBT7134439.1 DNA-directed DNA polymerase II small subunit [Candidatus Woesearchaeota archaeon]